MAKVEGTILNGDIIEYDDETHTYYCNGVKCISVTQLLHFKFPNKYKDVSKDLLKRRAAYGTKIHACIQLYEDFGVENDDVLELQNYKILKEDTEFEVLETEKIVMLKYKDLVVCGRLDLIISQYDKIGLSDIKTTYELDREYLCYQLNLYRLAHQQTYGGKIDFISGIWLRYEKKQFTKLPINEYPIYKLLDNYLESLKNEIQ